MAAASKPRVAVIGLELGDGKLLHAWAQAGKLPFLKSMIDRGCWGWLETTADVLHISAWPSIYTGATPGEHGVYFTFQPAPGLQGYQRFHEGLYGKPTIWKLLDGEGRHCAVLDPPYSHPEQGFGGVFVYDWGSWAHYLAPGSVPPTAIKQLEKQVGAYPLGLEAHDLGFQALDPATTTTMLIDAVKIKADAICWLMQQRQQWDLVFSVFGETHVAGHYCLASGANGAAADAQPQMLEIYRSLDEAIRRIHAAAGEDTTLILISGDCVGINHAGWHLLPDVLARLGFLADGSAPSAPPAACAGGAPLAAPAKKKFDPVKALRDLLPKGLRKDLARLLPTALRDKLAQRVDTADTDWSRTRAYCLPTDLEGYIRINLRGREPQGIVEPGAEYAAVLRDISAALFELRDPQTGTPVVREVIRTDEAFPGERRAYLPDLIVRWNAERPIRAVQSPRIGTVSKDTPDSRPGTHTGPGFVLATGPGIAPAAQLDGAHILDFAPTLLGLMGVAPPLYMRGRVWRELVPATRA